MASLLATGLWLFLRGRASAGTITTGGSNNAPAQAAPALPYVPTTVLTPQHALALASYFEQVEFGGWFASKGYTAKDIVAMWQVESNLDPRAIGDNGRSYGLGQVQAGSAAEVGFNDPTALLVAENGALASMRYLKLTYDRIVSRADSPFRLQGLASPPFQHLVWAYNAGIGNYWKNRMPVFTATVHIPRWKAARARLG